MKKRMNGSGSIYYESTRKGTKRWCAAISHPECGRIVRRFYTQKEAAMWLKVSLNDIFSNDVVFQKNMTIGEWIITYVKTYKTHVRPSTLRSYISYLKRLLPILDLKLNDRSNMFLIQKLFNELTLVLNPHTLNCVHAFFHSAIKKAYDLQIIPFDYSAAIETPKNISAPPIKVFSSHDIQQFLKYFHEHDSFVYLPFMIGLYTGARLGEVLALTWADIDFEHELLSINKIIALGGDLKFYVQPTTKTSSGIRTISIPVPLLSILRQAYANSRDPSDTGYVCTLPVQRVYPFITTSVLVGAFCKIRKQLKVNQALTFHCLRHTHASLLLASGIPVPVVAKRLGHKNSQITMSTYVHFIPGTLDLYRDKIDSISHSFSSLDVLMKPHSY